MQAALQHKLHDGPRYVGSPPSWLRALKMFISFLSPFKKDGGDACEK